MNVKVKLFAHLRDDRFVEKDMEIPDGSTVGKLLQLLGIGEDEVGVTMIDSRHCLLADKLKEGCTVAIFPMVGGG